jgi:hypothetical protein
MQDAEPSPTLDRPAAYEIKVPGEIDLALTDWDGELTVTISREGGGTPVATLTGSLDQAALHGVLRRLYSLGLPLISVVCVRSTADG